MPGLAEFINNLTPGQLEAISRFGTSIGSLGRPYMDPTEPGRNFQQGLAGIPGAVQAANRGALQDEALRGEIDAREAAVRRQAEQAAAVQGLQDYIMRGGAAGGAPPGPAAPPVAGPATGGAMGLPAPTGPGPAAGSAPGPGAAAGGMPPELMQLVANAYPELFAQQYISRALAPPGKTQRFKLGPEDVLTDAAGNVLAKGTGKKEEDTSVIKNMKAAGISPDSPEGRDLLIKHLTKAGTQVTIKEGEKKAAFFTTRMKAASDRLRQLEGTGYDATTLLEKFRNVSNWTRSREGQQYRAAAREWLAPVLRYESGAAIPEAEYETYYETYFPKPGDSPETVQQKAAARQSLEGSMFGAYGGTAETLGMTQPPPRSRAPGRPTPGKKGDRDRLYQKYGLTR